MDQFNQLISEYKLPLIISLLGVVLIIGGVFSSGLVTKPKASYPKESIVDSKSSLIKVDISGAVEKPGVYTLYSGMRVEDAIKTAGGFSTKASAQYVSKSLNLSQKISDGQKIYIPFAGEPVVVAQVGGVSQIAKVGINIGTSTQLESLPGIGPVTASKIIAARPYFDINELVTKKAVSKSVFEKIKDLVEL